MLAGAKGKRFADELLGSLGELPSDLRACLAASIAKSEAPRKSEILAALRLPEIGARQLEQQDLNDPDTWELASWSADPSLLAHARQVLASQGADYSRPFESLGNGSNDEELAKVVDYVSAKARTAAMRVLQGSARNPDRSGDAELVRAELEKRHWLTSDAALDALLQLGDVRDTDLLLERALEHPYGDQQQRRLKRALSIAGQHKALELGRHDVELVASAAVAYLQDDATTTTDALTPFLYSPHATVRVLALEGIAQRSSRLELDALLDSYPHGGTDETYYYNVIAWLDNHLYGPGTAEAAAEYFA